MSLYKSSLAILKISSDDTTFQTIAGIKKHQLHIQQAPANTSHIGETHWRELGSEMGFPSATISAQGIFSDSAAEQLLLSRMLSGTVTAFQLCLPNGSVFAGDFLIADYSRLQEINSEETFTIRLESAGSLSYS